MRNIWRMQNKERKGGGGRERERNVIIRKNRRGEQQK
jgi:hypothetical protein